MKIQPGVDTGINLRVGGQGDDGLRSGPPGDLYVEVNVEIPVNLTSKQKKILKEFEKEGGISKAHSPKSQSFFRKIKEVWNDLT